MAKTKSRVTSTKLYLCKTRLSQALRPTLEAGVHEDCVVVWVTPGATVQNAEEIIQFSPPVAGSKRTAVLVYEGTPIDADALTGWRSHLLQKIECEVRCLFLTGNETTEEATKLFEQKAANLIGAIPPPEPKAVGIGELVSAPERAHGNTLLLTMFFDSLGELLTQMDGIKRRFRDIVPIDAGAKRDLLGQLAEILKGTGPDQTSTVDAINAQFEQVRRQRECIPRVLLLGESGVGKTLFANHLGDDSTPVTRVSVAEFINKEDMLEYALFGYGRGAYTSAREDGDPGLLFSNLGGVLFLDEIGTATPAIQAKLLAYLDDFMVRPRGLIHSLFCPVLIVAATNEDVLRNQDYRQDLLQRFTDIHRIPPLRKLKHNFRYLIDVHLQNPAINPSRLDHEKKMRRVTEVGQKAYARLVAMDYESGNFREFGNILREACRQAGSSGRHYLLEEDISRAQSAMQENVQ